MDSRQLPGEEEPITFQGLTLSRSTPPQWMAPHSDIGIHGLGEKKDVKLRV